MTSCNIDLTRVMLSIEVIALVDSRQFDIFILVYLAQTKCKARGNFSDFNFILI